MRLISISAIFVICAISVVYIYSKNVNISGLFNTEPPKISKHLSKYMYEYCLKETDDHGELCACTITSLQKVLFYDEDSSYRLLYELKINGLKLQDRSKKIYTEHKNKCQE